MVEMVSKPGHPIRLTSSHGVGVSVRMDGVKPRVHLAPKDMKHGKVGIGGATVSVGCDRGQLIAHDFSTAKDYLVLEVVKSFLERCQALIKDRMPATGAAPDATGTAGGDGDQPQKEYEQPET